MTNPILAVLAALFVAAPAVSNAAVDAGDIPGAATWYLHADLEGMRGSDSGNALYGWLSAEIFVEINEEIGIDIDEEVDRVTAFSQPEAGVVIVLEGPVSDKTRDMLLALVALESEFDLRSHGGRDYYFMGEDGGTSPKNLRFDDLDESAYLSFALPGKLLVTSREDEMRALLERDGRIAGSGGHGGALLVLTADKSFVQAGMRTSELAEDADIGWDSNILRNTEQAALMLADRNGFIAVEAQLKSTDPRMAASLSSVVSGLLSLQALNSELDPGIQSLISNTKVSVADAVLEISTVFDPASLVKLLND